MHLIKNKNIILTYIVFQRTNDKKRKTIPTVIP